MAEYGVERQTVFTPHTIRVGIIGTGWGTKVQVPQFQKAGLQVVAICSRSADKAKLIAAEVGVPYAFSTVEELVACNDVDLVSITSPPYLHAQHTLAALEAGKHVLCEKPLCMNVQEAMQMVEAAKRRPQQVALTDHELRFSPFFQKARSLIDTGALGTLRHVSIHFIIPEGIWPNGAPRTWSWWADADAGGGLLGALGSHMVDALRFLLRSEVSKVSAHLSTLIPYVPDESARGELKKATADDYVSARLFCVPSPSMTPSSSWSGIEGVDVTMTLVNAGSATAVKREILVLGSQGSALLDVGQGSLAINGDTDYRNGGIISEGSSPFRDSGTSGLGHAIQKALGPEKQVAELSDAATLEDGLAVMKVLDAIRASSANGGASVILNPSE